MDKPEDINEKHASILFQDFCPGRFTLADGRRLQSYAAEADRMIMNVGPSSDIIVREDGWTNSLSQMPFVDSSKLDEYVICGGTDATVIAGAPKAFSNKKNGYKLWREG